MPLSGVFSWFCYIYMNEGIKRRAAGGRIPRRQAGSQTGGETGNGSGARGDVDRGACTGKAVWD